MAAIALLLVVSAMLLPSAEAHHLADAGFELPDVIEVDGGWMHSCARTGAGEVYCWGNNATANLGDGTVANVRPLAQRVTGFDAPVSQVSAGKDHTCALTTLGDIWCWGSNQNGQLGGPSTDLGIIRRIPSKVSNFGSANNPKFTHVTAGGSHTCARQTDGTAWCWGWTESLGMGGSAPSQLPPQKVFDGAMGRVQKIVAGDIHTCALSNAGALWCWGEDLDGRLGDGTQGPGGFHGSIHSVPVRVASVNGFPDGGVISFDLGSAHTCAVTAGSKVYCWGDNAFGRLGNPTNNSSLVPIHVSKRFGGTNFTGQFVAVTTGLDHTCTWESNGTGWCWGRSAYGQLGDGIVATTQTLPRYPVYNQTLLRETVGSVVSLSAGYNHTCGVFTGGKPFCFGHNGLGQGGDGTFVFHKEPAKVLQLTSPA